jgi:4'-phosphopantetheinyl transferase
MDNPCNWSFPPTKLELAEDEIHLWRASLDLRKEVLDRCASILSQDERLRASRFLFPRDRDHFVAARGILRELLGKYAADSPALVEFQYGERGKPALRAENGKPLVRFNLSHSHGLAVYAFARNRELGIDLEPIRPEFSGEDIAERYFSPQELEEWRRLTPELRAEAFFLCWTRKEAYVKARGEGLQIPLASFSVTLTPGQSETLQSVDSARWRLLSFRPASGYAAALAGEGKDWRLLQWDWRPQEIGK